MKNSIYCTLFLFVFTIWGISSVKAQTIKTYRDFHLNHPVKEVFVKEAEKQTRAAFDREGKLLELYEKRDYAEDLIEFYHYDENGRLSLVTADKKGKIVLETYRYDANGNLTYFKKSADKKEGNCENQYENHLLLSQRCFDPRQNPPELVSDTVYAYYPSGKIKSKKSSEYENSYTTLFFHENGKEAYVLKEDSEGKKEYHFRDEISLPLVSNDSVSVNLNIYALNGSLLTEAYIDKEGEPFYYQKGEMEYHPNGKPKKATIILYDGAPNGKVITYYNQNGDLIYHDAKFPSYDSTASWNYEYDKFNNWIRRTGDGDDITRKIRYY